MALLRPFGFFLNFTGALRGLLDLSPACAASRKACRNNALAAAIFSQF